MMPRFRFAPSPTGSPHVGTLHTALFSWGLARALGGDVILRIDDTDASRNRAEDVQAMIDALHWLGLDWDEGPDIGGDCGPYVQSHRRERHAAVAALLLERGAAYVDDSAETRQKPIRLRMPSEGVTIFDDALRGSITFDNANLPDPIIVRGDGSPLYHLANAADDHDMGITHVVRGDDWISSTPIQIAIFRALDWPLPVWVHLPLILNKERRKLSKRDPEGGYLVDDFRNAGYLPQALFNYLLLLGWSPDGEQEIVSKWDVYKQFTIDRLSASAPIFDWGKLNWLNRHYLRQYSDEDLAGLIRPILEEAYGAMPVSAEWLVQLTRTIRDELVTLQDAVDSAEWAFDPPPLPNDAAQLELATPHAPAVLTQLIAELATVVILDAATGSSILNGLRRQFRQQHDLNARAVLIPIRVALTGKLEGPPLHEIMGLLGKQRCLDRLAASLRHR
ncbi:MAG: glutamate--tRNA ligase [Anaerolineae bacterium]|nr:glutamate--tRNA ligase [Anaerolineae bacterium]